MLGSLLYFEIKYHFKQITFRASAILFLGLGMLMTQGNFGGAEVYKNGPYVINFIICLLSLFLIFVSTLFSASVVLRDKTHQMDELVFSTSITQRTYFLVKLAGLLLAVFLILGLGIFGMFLGSALLLHEQKGDLNLLYYLRPLLIFGLPNVLFCSSFIFSTAMLTRNIRAVYASGVFAFILYFVASILGNSPLMANSALKPGGPDMFSLLADPLGITAFFGATKNWSVAQRNTQLFDLEDAFLANRLLWTTVSLLVITVSYFFFRFRITSENKSKKSKIESRETRIIAYKPIFVHSRGFGYFFAGFKSQIGLELSSIFKQPVLMVVLALWMFLFGVELKGNIFHGPYGIRFYPTTGLVIEQLMSMSPALLLLVFYASELIHREHAAKMQALVFSTPISNATLFLAKISTLAALIGILISCNIVTGIGLQILSEYSQIDLLPYFSLFYYSGLPLLLFAVLIIFIQIIIPNKYLGMLLSLLAVGISIFGKMLGIKHYLFRFASTPAVFYSAFNGFGHYTKAFGGYMMHWTLLACLLGILIANLWPDGTHDTWGQRMKTGLKQWNFYTKILASVGLLLWICSCYFIYQKTISVNLGRANKPDLQWQKQYELKYKSVSQLEQPIITSVKINTDIYPDEKRYTVRGILKIRNKSINPIYQLQIGVNPEVNSVMLQIPGASRKRFDHTFKQYLFGLEKPLLPNGELSLKFSLDVERSGFLPFNSENSVVSNGSYIELEKFLPFFGYNSSFEISDAFTRKENGLLPQKPEIETDHRYHPIDFENIISTNTDQQIVTVGTLKKSWKKGKRNYFHYKTEQPIGYMFALSCARYAVLKEKHRGVEFRIFYQPGQTQNLRAMMDAMKDAIEYGDSTFSKYPLKQLTLAEIPAYPGSATAYPGVIFGNEKMNFLSDFSDSTRFNFTYATTAHEVAHQWWANQISPQNGPGYAFLTESLAKYTEAVLAEKRFGKMRLRQYLRADNNLYFNMRNTGSERELPLHKTRDQPFVHYQKGGLALYAIREVLGEKRINDALKNLADNHSFPNQKPSPTDFINELNRNATPFEKRLIDAHLKKVIIYNNRIKVLSTKPMGNNQFQIKLLVTVQKTDQTNTKTLKMQPDDLIDIAVFGEDESAWDSNTKPLYFKKYHIHKSETIIEITVDRAPRVAAIDPYGYFLDEDLGDNVGLVATNAVL